MSSTVYDVVIIGAGPAGLTAALYARRAEKSVLILEKETFGGQITHSPKVENYPGFMQMSGNEFADKLLDQVMALEAEIQMEEARGVEKRGELRAVLTDSGEYLCRSVIIATGSKHRQLGLPNENELIGEGVSYCAVCDGAFYADKRIAIVGGGNTALQETVMLSDICEHVTVVQNLPMLTGEQKLVDIVNAKENVTVITETVVDALLGEGSLRALSLRNTATGEVTELSVDGVFVAIGQVPENAPFASVTALDERGYIRAGEDCLTDDAAVFVAGDCRTKQVRQITTATGDGAVAAVAACKYLDATR